MTDLTETLETKTETLEPVEAATPKAQYRDFGKYATALHVKHNISEELVTNFLHTWFRVRLLEEVENGTISPEQIAEMHEDPVEEVYLFLYGNSWRFRMNYALICNHLNVSFKEFLKIDFL